MTPPLPMSSSPSSSFSSSAGVAPAGGIDLTPLHDVTCEVAVVLGTGLMSVRQCLYRAPKTIIPRAQLAGTDLQMLVNGVPVAVGEVVVLDDSTAVRVTHIVPPPSTEEGA
jgi:flagellar motor switch/type III secretory pathway protein FliN